MNRSSFLKKLLGGVIVAAAMPSEFIKKENTVFINSDDLKKPAQKLIPWRADNDWMCTSSFITYNLVENEITLS